MGQEKSVARKRTVKVFSSKKLGKSSKLSTFCRYSPKDWGVNPPSTNVTEKSFFYSELKVKTPTFSFKYEKMYVFLRLPLAVDLKKRLSPERDLL